MKRAFFIFSFAIIQLYSFSQTRQDSIQQAFVFVDTLLVNGTHTFQIVDYVYPQNIQDLAIKMNNAIAANKEWYLDYTNKYYVPGTGLPYDPHMGLTEQEYSQLKHIDTVQTILTILKSGEVEIRKTDDLITFKSLGKDRLLDFISIYLNKYQMIFGADTIEFSHAMNINNSRRMGPFQGYLWSSESMVQPNPGQLDQINGKIIHIIFAKTGNGQSFIHLQFKQIDWGKPVANVDLLIFLK